MTGGRNQLPGLLLVLVLSLFEGVTSDIDEGGFDEDDFNGLYGLFHVRIFLNKSTIVSILVPNYYLYNS